MIKKSSAQKENPVRNGIINLIIYISITLIEKTPRHQINCKDNNIKDSWDKLKGAQGMICQFSRSILNLWKLINPLFDFSYFRFLLN
jgi:hypothetical protein